MNSYEEQVNNSFFTVTILNFQSLLNNMLHFQITVFQYYYIGFTKNENKLVISFWQNGCQSLTETDCFHIRWMG